METIDLKGINETIYYDECNNGLKLYMWVNKKVSSFYATLSVKYGSIYNEYKVGGKKFKTNPGVAHFLEHVKFNIDEYTTAHDVFEKFGSDTNAFTTFNYTNYQVYGNDFVKENVLELINFVENDYFTKKIIANEKGIIIEEAKMSKDDPYTIMLYKHLDNIFNNYEHKRLITGEVNDIKKINIDEIHNVFNSFYHPQNMFLVITGNFNPYELVSAIKDDQNKKSFSKYNNPIRIKKKESKKVKKVYDEIECNVNSRKIKIGVKIPVSSMKQYDLRHIKIYLNLLIKANFGSTSDFRDYLLTNELVNDISYMVDIFDDYIIIMFTIDSDCKDEIIKLFNDKLNNLDITEKTFLRMKKANIASLILDYEDVESVNFLIQNEVLSYGDITNNLKELYESLSYKEMVNFKKNLSTKERSVLILNPIQK